MESENLKINKKGGMGRITLDIELSSKYDCQVRQHH